MGWLSDDPLHEGYLIGFVERAGVTPGGGLLRECAYPQDGERLQLVAVAAGCDCGWRSPRWMPARPALWLPYAVEASPDEEERGRAAWRQHLEHEGIGRSPWLAEPSAPTNVIPLRSARPGMAVAGQLELRQEASGPRHYLDDRPIHAGETLEVRVARGVCRHDFTTVADEARAGVWLRGRYEWSFTPGTPPRFYIELGDTHGDCAGLADSSLPPDAILRWPEEA
jgi:hypothetical protein